MAEPPPDYAEATASRALRPVEGRDDLFDVEPYLEGSHGALRGIPHLAARRNVVGLLNDELVALAHVGSPPFSVAIGLQTDPYPFAEATAQYTRGLLHCLAGHHANTQIVTRLPLIRRDLDLLTEIGHSGSLLVHILIPSLDATVTRVADPLGPPPRARLQLVEELANLGIPVAVATVTEARTPGTSERDRQALAQAAAHHGALLTWTHTRLVPPPFPPDSLGSSLPLSRRGEAGHGARIVPIQRQTMARRRTMPGAGRALPTQLDLLT